MTTNPTEFLSRVGFRQVDAATAIVLSPGADINGVLFTGAMSITVTAAAGTLTGTTLNATVVNSSLTSLGVDANLPGSPTTTTQATGDNTTKIATDAFVNASIAAIPADHEPTIYYHYPVSGPVVENDIVMSIVSLFTSQAPLYFVRATNGGQTYYSAVYGVAKNVSGGFADIWLGVGSVVPGFSFGVFVGVDYYLDNANPGKLTYNPPAVGSTPNAIKVGRAMDATNLLLYPVSNFLQGKGALYTSDGTYDEVLAVGGDGNVLVAKASQVYGLQWLPAVVAAAPFTYTTATRTLTIATATNSVAGVLSAADHTTFAGYAASIALKANIASPTFTGTVTTPNLTVTNPISGSITGNAATATLATTVTTNANLTGPVTSVGNATAIANGAIAPTKLSGTATQLYYTDSTGFGGQDANLTFNDTTHTLSATIFAGIGSGLTGTAASLTAGTVTTNANLTGPVTSVGNATAIANGAVSPLKLSGTAGQVYYTDPTGFGGQDAAFTFTDATKTLSSTNITATAYVGDVNASTGNVLISTLGKGLQVKTGANSKIGTAVLVAGAVTVANTSVTANSRIFVTSQTDGGVPGFLRVSAKTVSTSFVITSSSVADTSTVAWVIIESIP